MRVIDKVPPVTDHWSTLGRGCAHGACSFQAAQWCVRDSLEVPVRDAHAVAVRNGRQHLVHQACRVVLRVPAALTQRGTEERTRQGGGCMLDGHACPLRATAYRGDT